MFLVQPLMNGVPSLDADKSDVSEGLCPRTTKRSRE
jgi:hypothetical protein